ncbi:hypothetical protein [Pseudoxanthomonas sp. J35]|uniref:hypothetical protein n=1 Tax=Pseudoxanthomonas sp. J35 TaxID=935852 RepID=UPI00048E7345|nr:hypothetical protein [Pseudoxanthomonas sp. J35]
MEPLRTVEDNVRGHGRKLRRVSLAAGVALVGYTLWAVALLWLLPDALDADLLARHFDLVVSDPAALGPVLKVLLTPAFALTGLQLLLPIAMLYRLGNRFDQPTPLNRRTAAAVRRLSHSIVISLIALPMLAGVLTGLAHVIAALDGVVVDTIRSGFDSIPHFLGGLGAGIGLPVVACTCLYSLAWRIRIGADASDDARSIV